MSGQGVGRSVKSLAPWFFDLTQWLTAASLEPVKRQIEEWTSAERRDRVLDLCCGTGAFAELAPAEYLGVDLDAGAIALAQKRREQDAGRTFQVGDVSALKVEPKSFDLVIFANGMHHMSDEAALETLRIARDAARGPIIIIDPALETKKLGSRLLFALEQGEYLRSLVDQQTLLNKAGLVIERASTLHSGLAHQRIFLCRVG